MDNVQITSNVANLRVAPLVVDTTWFQFSGKAYVYPCLDGDGFISFSADDGAFLVWSQNAADARVDASLAEMERMPVDGGETYGERSERIFREKVAASRA